MTQVTIQGRQYSDDGTTARDMLNGGHRLHFFPLVQDIVTTAADVAADEAAAAISATNAANSAASTQGTSTTSNTVGSGSKTFTTQINKQFAIGSMLTVSRTSAPSTLMHGQVTAYNSSTGSLTVNVSNFAGSGTYTDWTIALSGIAGPTGATGDGSLTYMSVTGATTLTTTDKAKFIECNGTFTLSFQAAATLGSTWATTIKNVGTGNITLDPNGSETIDGVTTTVLYPGEMIKLHSNGTVLRSVYRSLNRLQRVPILSTESASLTGISQGDSLRSAVANFNDTNTITALSSSGSIFVKTSFTSGSVLESSTDGITWVNRTLTTSALWTANWVGSKFLATNGNNTTVNQSTDGITWTATTALPGAADVSGIAYDGSSILLVQSQSANTTAYRSTDGGGSWTTQTKPSSTRVVFAAGVFISYSDSTNTYYTSTTGLTGSWTTRTFPGSRSTMVVLTGGTIACLLTTSTSTSIMTSTDGINWTDTGVYPPFEVTSVDRINGTWIFVRNSSEYNTVTKHANYVERASIGNLYAFNSGRRVSASVGNTLLLGSSVIYLNNPTTGIFSS